MVETFHPSVRRIIPLVQWARHAHDSLVFIKPAQSDPRWSCEREREGERGEERGREREREREGEREREKGRERGI